MVFALVMLLGTDRTNKDPNKTLVERVDAAKDEGAPSLGIFHRFDTWKSRIMKFVDNKEVKPTANYYVQRAFGQNSGDEYIYADLQTNGGNNIRERLDYSVVKDTKTSDIIIKVVSLLPKASTLRIQLGDDVLKGYSTTAELSLLAQENEPDRQRNWDRNETRTLTVSSEFPLNVPQYSMSVIRIKKSKK